MSGSAAVCSFCGDSGAEDKGVFMICKKCDAVKVLAERQGVFWHVQSQRYAYCGKPPGGGLKLGNIPRISFVLDFHGVADLFEAEELAKVVDPSTAIILSHVKPTASMRLKKQEMLVPYMAAGFDCWLSFVKPAGPITSEPHGSKGQFLRAVGAATLLDDRVEHVLTAEYYGLRGVLIKSKEDVVKYFTLGSGAR